jgi:hypothetical protein
MKDSVTKMRATVEALELQVERSKQATPSERAASLQQLRHWRLQSTCRYVGKSFVAAKAMQRGAK